MHKTPVFALLFTSLLLSLICLGYAGTGFEFVAGETSPAPAAAKPVAVPVSPLVKQKKIHPRVAASWADSVLQTMTSDERIGQLFTVYAYSNRNQSHTGQVSELVSKYKVGGLIFFQGGPLRQARLTNHYQSLARVPLMVAMDAEWGLGMRLDSTMSFPYQMALGAIQNDSLIYQMGAEIARQCRRLGVHINFAPVVDINNNPANPVINARSFGENRDLVVSKGIAYMKGMQDNGVLACAKHFPGHGDTDKDSHHALPTIPHSAQRLDSVELYPFKKLIAAGVGSLMTAHLYIPAYDTMRNRASSLSSKVVTDLLQKQLGYTGLIFTDALGMKGASEFNKPGQVDLLALLAGNDVLLCSDSVPAAIGEIKKALQEGKISQQLIDRHCLKILQTKYALGLHKEKPVRLEGLTADLNTPGGDWLKRQLAEASLTLLSNQQEVLPLQKLESRRIATLSIGAKDSVSIFQEMLAAYAPVTHFKSTRDPGEAQSLALTETLKNFNTIIVGLHGAALRPSAKDGISPATAVLLKKLGSLAREKNTDLIVAVFANPYNLSRLDSLEGAKAILLGYEDTPYAQNFGAQVIFGGIEAKGKLPVTASQRFTFQQGISQRTQTALGEPFGIPAPFRFKYTVPEELGIDSRKLRKADSLVQVAITQQAIPGCQVVAIKNGKVFYRKSFGYHTYENRVPVNNSDIYDLASVTKVSTAIPALMKLAAEGKLDLNQTLGTYLPQLRHSNKDTLTIREVLAHQAGLQAWIPFWKNTLDESGKLSDKIYRKEASRKFSMQVADHLYINRKYFAKHIFKEIKNSPLLDKKTYVYSDLSYYLYPQIVEKLAKKSFPAYLQENFYAPLGAGTLGYNPLERFPKSRIVPTEYDSVFRQQLLYGTVHDEGAALLGGVSSHAGLFGNATDLAKLMNVYLCKGTYAQRKYLPAEVIAAFTRQQYPGNRRGIGFDRPDPKSGNAAASASAQSFGHSGFTGTFVWIDPAENFIYIFLSNRVYPTRENNRLGKLNTRTNVQEAFYQAMRN